MVVEWWWENCSKLVWSSYQRVRLTYTFQLVDSKFLKFISWSSWTSGLQRFQHVLFMVSGVFYYFNSILNPILYTILSRFMINYLSSLAVIPTSHVQWSTLISFLNFSRRFRRGFSDIYKKCWINHQVKGQFHNLMKFNEITTRIWRQNIEIWSCFAQRQLHFWKSFIFFLGKEPFPISCACTLPDALGWVKRDIRNLCSKVLQFNLILSKDSLDPVSPIAATAWCQFSARGGAGHICPGQAQIK